MGFVPVRDGLSFLEGLLGLTRVQACMPPYVPTPQPGPCPGSPKRRRKPWRFPRQRKVSVVARPGAGGYTGPRFEVPVGMRLRWDAALRDTARGDGQAAKDRVQAFRAKLTGAQLRRFDQQAAIAAAQDAWRRSAGDDPDVPVVAQEKMRRALRQLWAGKKIAVRVTADSLEQVLRTGRFKTVHETYKTAGFNDGKARRDLEEQVFGIDPDGGQKDKRPVYGYVAVNGVRRPGLDSALGQYGSVQVVLKDRVRARTTASNGDSIGHRKTVMPSPVDDPQHWSYAVTGQPPGVYDVDGEKLAARSYAEAQIHGGVTLDDIDEVVFAREPDERVQRRLAEKGIPWRIVQD